MPGARRMVVGAQLEGVRGRHVEEVGPRRENALDGRLFDARRDLVVLVGDPEPLDELRVEARAQLRLVVAHERAGHHRVEGKRTPIASDRDVAQQVVLGVGQPENFGVLVVAAAAGLDVVADPEGALPLARHAGRGTLAARAAPRRLRRPGDHAYIFYHRVAQLEPVLEHVHVPDAVVGDVVREQGVRRRVDDQGALVRGVDGVGREGERRRVAAHVRVERVLAERGVRPEVGKLHATDDAVGRVAHEEVAAARLRGAVRAAGRASNYNVARQ
mmetsp:Transcript_19623/g.58356  ORF Transcript_19623/g.58356 Transcript_19623/m.58356 type:complete len:273 (+) Transcript_19623:1459-2277(+)